MRTETLLKELLQLKYLSGIKQSTLSTYTYKANVLLGFLPEYVEDITEHTLIEIIQKLPYHQKSKKDMISLLKSFIQYANERNLVELSIDFIPIPRTSTKNKIIIFTSQEQKTLEKYLFRNINFYNFGILLALYTGVRIGELSALKFKDIKKDVLKVNKTLQRIKNLSQKGKAKTIIQIDTPKSQNSIRDIPLVDHILRYLKQLNIKNSENYVITGTNKFIEPRVIERKFCDLLKSCNIEQKNFHVLRHTFATNALRKNMNLKVLSEILGHSSLKSTEVYLHLDFELKKESMKIFEPCSSMLSYPHY